MEDKRYRIFYFELSSFPHFFFMMRRIKNNYRLILKLKWDIFELQDPTQLPP